MPTDTESCACVSHDARVCFLSRPNGYEYGDDTDCDDLVEQCECLCHDEPDEYSDAD
jgi:hypothetical protein